ncbi:endonuclease/exonuclease/phosphatase family protein [Gordonia sp. NPDC003585]|uniref:endonuclease/exonuclease/phosphatase family protein n=1 Tax=Gordonia sp. NPDC003585 TaxID=3154275 RepID=UPI0033A62BCC
MRKYIAAALLVVGWVLLAVVCVAVWLHYYPVRSGFTIRMTSRVPLAVVPAAGALLIFVLLRRWFMLGFAVIATVALVWTQLPLWIGENPPPGERFTVVTANLRLGQADLDTLADLVERSDADLLSMQEVTPEALARIRTSSIARELPHEFAIPVPQSGGTALFSKRPLVDPAPVPNTADRNLSARTDLPGAPGARVLAIHPRAPLGGQIDSWQRDLSTIGAYLRALPDERVVAAGDFNSTWDSPRFRDLLTEGYADSVEQVGGGFLPTFPANRGVHPWITLDHVVTRGFAAASVNTYDIPGSDHRAVVVSLVAS